MQGGRAGQRLCGSFTLRLVCRLCAAMLLASVLRCAQGQTAEKVESMAIDAHPSIELATVKRSDPMDQAHRFTIEGHRILIENQTVSMMIQMSYGVHVRQLVGGPSWIESERFDIQALPDVAGQPDVLQFKEMVRKVLEERFGLKMRTEKQEMPRYTLTVAKGGPKMEPTKGVPDGLPRINGNGNKMSMSLTMKNVTMGDVAQQLQGALDRPVVDETGLKGKYDLSLKWLQPDAAPAAADDADSALPGVFTALQEQAGLKVEPTKGEVDVLVITHVEQPSAD